MNLHFRLDHLAVAPALADWCGGPLGLELLVFRSSGALRVSLTACEMLLRRECTIRAPDPPPPKPRAAPAIGALGRGHGPAIMTAIGLVLLFLLTLATNNRALYERNYAWLLGVNVLVALLLLGVLVWIGAPGACVCASGGALAAVCWSNWRPSLRWWA